MSVQQMQIAANHFMAEIATVFSNFCSIYPSHTQLNTSNIKRSTSSTRRARRVSTFWFWTAGGNYFCLLAYMYKCGNAGNTYWTYAGDVRWDEERGAYRFELQLFASTNRNTSFCILSHVCFARFTALFPAPHTRSHSSICLMAFWPPLG